MDSQAYENSDRKMPDIEIIKRTWKYIKPYWKKLLFSLILMLMIVGIEIATPLITAKVIDTLTIQYDEIGNMIPVDITSIYFLSGIFFGLVMAQSVVIYLNSMNLQRLGQSVIYDLRMIVFKHIDSLSVSQLNNIPVGSLVTRLTSDTNALSDLFTNTIVNLIKNAIMLISVVVMLYVINWKMALIISIYIPIIFIATYIFRKYARANYRKTRQAFSIMNAFLNENISGMKITQIFNQEKRKSSEFDSLNNNIIKTRQKDIRIFSIYRPLISFLYFTAIGITFLMGGYAALNGILSIGIVYSFYEYVSKMFNPIQQLADQFNSLQRAFTSSERLYNLLDTVPEVLDHEGAQEINEFKGHIEFKHVWFAYNEENWILRDVSFEVEAGQVVAFVGATGAGKTTILQLIVRNYEVQKGEILIDGINVNDIKIESLRKHIGQMLQDVFLFSGTVRTNITLRDNSFNDEEIMDAVKYVNAESFVSSLDKGLDAEVQERGENFSSGQRQLLSFARTILHKPQILILDEATANIDTETEQVIQQSLINMMNIGTMLIVAHRLSTIQHADNIICLQNGRIIEQGTHHQLLKNHGYYFNLYKLQFEDQEQ